jgi:multiple sugar transport system ATP-binding protein
VESADGLTLTGPGLSVPIGQIDGMVDGDLCTLGIRPEHIEIVSEGTGHTSSEVAFAEQLGGETYLYCDADGLPQITVHQQGQLPISKSQKIALKFDIAQMHMFDANGQVIAQRRTS